MLPDILLFITALIWGLAFVAQRVGMNFLGPFTYNGIRFILGALPLVPLIIVLRMQKRRADGGSITPMPWAAGVGVGAVLFLAASLQQVGLVYTTAGNAGFITGLYVVFVPLLGLFGGQKPGRARWTGALLAAAGMYFLSVGAGFHVNPGDLFILGSALFFAVHVQVIGHLAGKFDALEISFLQYASVGLFSLITSAVFEQTPPGAIRLAGTAILYGGLGSITVAYTLQIIAQRRAAPTHAAILLSLEGTFAAVGGWLILHEILSPRALFGCALMLSGMILSQLAGRRRDTRKKPAG